MTGLINQKILSELTTGILIIKLKSEDECTSENPKFGRQREIDLP
jgi:hypothetical protein